MFIKFPIAQCIARSIKNLFLAGRITSASHIAFGSTRVMATCAHSAQAVGMAAAMCIQQSIVPRDLLTPDLMNDLQQRLLARGQHIPGLRAADPTDVARKATITASSFLNSRRCPVPGRQAIPPHPALCSSRFQPESCPISPFMCRSGSRRNSALSSGLHPLPAMQHSDVHHESIELAINARRRRCASPQVSDIV